MGVRGTGLRPWRLLLLDLRSARCSACRTMGCYRMSTCRGALLISAAVWKGPVVFAAHQRSWGAVRLFEEN